MGIQLLAIGSLGWVLIRISRGSILGLCGCTTKVALSEVQTENEYLDTY